MNEAYEEIHLLAFPIAAAPDRQVGVEQRPLAAISRLICTSISPPSQFGPDLPLIVQKSLPKS
jgi:hypothetical protein